VSSAEPAGIPPQAATASSSNAAAIAARKTRQGAREAMCPRRQGFMHEACKIRASTGVVLLPHSTRIRPPPAHPDRRVHSTEVIDP